jgi:hypothetical protein
VEVQEFEFPSLQQPKVTPTVSKPLEANSDIANMIHGAVSASLNSKFVAMSENFESTMNSNLDRIEDKFGKQFSGNDINASTSNTENSKDNTLDDFSNLHIENKFHDYFFTGETELKLSHLVSVKQKSNEAVTEYIRRFRDTRNRCYSLTISDRDLADLAYSGLLDIHKEKLDGQEFVDISRLL